MQFPVPQFTDVEDKIIGSLTFKQFGIVFGAGLIIFLAYTVTKSILVVVFFAVLVGLPALGVAFIPFNGRPIYKMFNVLLKYLLSPKEMVFHKDSDRILTVVAVDMKAEATNTPTGVLTREDTQSRLKKVRTLLDKNAAEEADLVNRVR